MNIKDNAIIICENSYKESLLKKFSDNKLFLNVKFFTKREFFENYFFKYKDETLEYLTNKYGYKVSIAEMYLKNLYFIDEKCRYADERLKKLADIKNDLNDQGYLVYNSLFKQFLKDKNINVFGYSFLDNYEKDVFDKLDAFYESFDNSYNHSVVYAFDSVELEISFVLKRICHLIEDGISINKIKLMNVPSDYYNTLEKLAFFYDIPIKIPNQKSLYSLEIAKIFVDNYDSDINKTIDKIKDFDQELVTKIVGICNKYAYTNDYLNVKNFIIEDFKNTKINDYDLKNYVEIIDIDDYTHETDYVFVLNFNMGSIPKYHSDEDYITDSIKGFVNLKLTSDINKEIKKYTINRLKNIKNLVISYSKSINGVEHFPSLLIYDMNLNIIEENDDIKESYSSLYSKINYARMLDLYNKYGEINSDLGLYQNSLDTNYDSFDNKFSGLDKKELLKALNNKLTLSYSSFDIYNKCAFRYYLNNVLKLDEYSQNFEAFIGSIFHDILSKCFSNDLNVKDEINKYLKDNNKTLNAKEDFFVKKVIKDIEFVIEELKKQKELISLDNSLYEQKIVIDKSKEIPINFIGYIDKILYKETGDKTLFSLIDYKTGSVESDLKYLPYGFGMQLPMYLYLVQKANIFANPLCLGFYLEYILDKNIAIDPKKTYLEQKQNNLKLVGYSLNDREYLKKFDSSYANSKLISGMKTKNDGNFYHYAKVLSEKQMDKIVDIAEEKIDEMLDNILNGKFDINPKKISFIKDVGCQYCKFKDICFKKENDYVIYNEINDLSFLGGDEDA
ncbi:MAG: PD-(D/E)XK nuclease family protein [Bacilli bacterium]|nr:PD-(D/E)XK nuclease family protein [Bacilli bacterium]